MVIRRQNFCERVLLLETTLHDARLIASMIKIAIAHGKSELRRLQVIVSIGHRVSLPRLRHLHFLGDLVLLDDELVVVWVTWRASICILQLRFIDTFERQQQLRPRLIKRLVHVLVPRRENGSICFSLLLRLIVTSLQIKAAAIPKTPVLPLRHLVQYLAHSDLVVVCIQDSFSGDIIPSFIFRLGRVANG